MQFFRYFPKHAPFIVVFYSVIRSIIKKIIYKPKKLKKTYQVGPIKNVKKKKSKETIF